MHCLRRLRRQLVLGWNQEADLHDPGCPVQSQSAARDRRLDHKAIPYDNFWRVARETGMHILKFAHASFIEESLEPSFSEGTIRSTTGALSQTDFPALAFQMATVSPSCPHCCVGGMPGILARTSSLSTGSKTQMEAMIPELSCSPVGSQLNS
jgi:hypothetical protein